MIAGLLAGSVGCSKPHLQQPSFPGIPQQASGGVGQYFAPPSQPPTPSLAPSTDVAVMRPARKPGKTGLNPETEVALAATYLAAAMEKQTSSERDALLDQARQNLQRALSKDPKNRSAHVELARLYAYTSEKDRSIAILQQARAYFPNDHDLAYQQARICVTFADWAGGVEAINAALAIDPENRTYHKVAGICLANLNRFDQAQAALMRVMSESQALYFIGRVMIDQNQVERGRMQIEQAAALDPTNELATQFLSDYQQGLIRPMDAVRLVDHQEAVTTPATAR